MKDPGRVGLIVNPIAGMGGRAGLKGTDGDGMAELARELGAAPVAAGRAGIAIETLIGRAGTDLKLVTAPEAMGEHVARACGLDPVVLPLPLADPTTRVDTIRAARAIEQAGVDLLLFAGGDGTARDICEAIGAGPVVLGIPTGVKMHSSVYARNPKAAGELAARFLTSPGQSRRESEVMDIDEAAFRAGRVSARLFGYLNVPFQRGLLQGLKSGSSAGEDASGLAADIAERMTDGALWILGPGTTTRAIAESLGGPKTLLGVDLYARGEVVALDVTEQQILRHLDRVPARIVVTPIGGQGYLFGRGNQQISPEVIRRVRKENIVVVATMAKLAGLAAEPLLVDTGDLTLDQELAGYVRVVTGYRQESMQRVA